MGEIYNDSCFEYMNGKNKASFVQKDCKFAQFLAIAYEALLKHLNDYSIIVELKVKFSTQPSCLLPIDVFDDEMVRNCVVYRP